MGSLASEAYVDECSDSQLVYPQSMSLVSEPQLSPLNGSLPPIRSSLDIGLANGEVDDVLRASCSASDELVSLPQDSARYVSPVKGDGNVLRDVGVTRFERRASREHAEVSCLVARSVPSTRRWRRSHTSIHQVDRAVGWTHCPPPDVLVPGSPASLCEKLQKGDEIIAVNSIPANHENISTLILSCDSQNISLSVRKAVTYEIIEVELFCLPRKQVEEVSRLYDLLSRLKDEYKSPPEGLEAGASPLPEKIYQAVSSLLQSQYSKDAKLQAFFQNLYAELRFLLGDAYSQLDNLEGRRVDLQNLDSLATKLSITENQLIASEQEVRRLKSDLQNRADDRNNTELAEKTHELARSYEQNLQLEFDLKELQARLQAKDKDKKNALAQLHARVEELEQLKNVLEASEEHAQKLRISLNEKLEENDKLRDEIFELRSKHVEIESHSLSRISALEAEKTKIAEEHRSASTTIHSLQEDIHKLQKQIEDLQGVIDQFKQNEKRLKFRRGDCVHVKVMSLESLPSSFTDMDTYVMVSLDGKNQVHQTTRKSGQNIAFEEEFLCELNEDSSEIVILTYSGKPAVAAELIGTTAISLDSAEFGHTKELTKKIQVGSEGDVQSTITVRLHKFNTYKAKKDYKEDEFRTLKEDLANAQELMASMRRDYAAQLSSIQEDHRATLEQERRYFQHQLEEKTSIMNDLEEKIKMFELENQTDKDEMKRLLKAQNEELTSARRRLTEFESKSRADENQNSYESNERSREIQALKQELEFAYKIIERLESEKSSAGKEAAEQQKGMSDYVDLNHIENLKRSNVELEKTNEMLRKQIEYGGSGSDEVRSLKLDNHRLQVDPSRPRPSLTPFTVLPRASDAGLAAGQEQVDGASEEVAGLSRQSTVPLLSDTARRQD
eukprot:634615-Hanusia_phi.AAC.3